METGRADGYYLPATRTTAQRPAEWRITRYADDFVVLVHGTEADVHALREDIATVIAPLGPRLSQAKTRVVHIRWRRKRGTSQWYVNTFIADRPIKALKRKVRALTRRLSHENPGNVLVRLNQIQRGWANYFRHAVRKHTFNQLRYFVNWRVFRWWMKLYRWRLKDVRRRFTTPSGRWLALSADGIELFNIAWTTVTRCRYRGDKIPNPWARLNHA